MLRKAGSFIPVVSGTKRFIQHAFALSSLSSATHVFRREEALQNHSSTPNYLRHFVFVWRSVDIVHVKKLRAREGQCKDLSCQKSSVGEGRGVCACAG